MKLRQEFPLQAPAESTTSGSPSAATPPPSEAPQAPGTPIGPQGREQESVVDEVDWTAESTDVDEVDAPTEGEQPSSPPAQPPAKTPAQPPAQPPSQPPAQQPAAQPPTGDQPVPPQQQPPQQPPAQQPPAQPPQETPEQRVERERVAAEAEKKVFTDLVTYYKMPDEMAERLRTEPELALPEMAAKVHQAVFAGMQQWATQQIPQMFAHHQRMAEANTRTKEAFFGRWPSLKQHEKQVLQVGGMFLQMNPQATPEERLEKVGQLVCAALNITPDPKPGGQPPARPPQQPPPGQPQKRPAAMRPANPSGSSAAAPPPSDNPFTQLAEEFLEEDRGE